MTLISTNHECWKHWNITFQIWILLFVIFEIFCVSFYCYWFNCTENEHWSWIWRQRASTVLNIRPFIEKKTHLGNWVKWRRFNATIVPLIQKNIKYGKLFQQSKIAFLTLIFDKFFFICCFRDIFLLHFLLQSLPFQGYQNDTHVALWMTEHSDCSTAFCVSFKQPFFEDFFARWPPQLCCSKFSHLSINSIFICRILSKHSRAFSGNNRFSFSL